MMLLQEGMKSSPVPGKGKWLLQSMGPAASWQQVFAVLLLFNYLASNEHMCLV